jgi:hypothetical protein
MATRLYDAERQLSLHERSIIKLDSRELVQLVAQVRTDVIQLKRYTKKVKQPKSKLEMRKVTQDLNWINIQRSLAHMHHSPAKQSFCIILYSDEATHSTPVRSHRMCYDIFRMDYTALQAVVNANTSSKVVLICWSTTSYV